MSEGEGLDDGSEACYDVWFAHSVANKKTGGRAGDVKVFIGNVQDGQD